MSTTTTSRSGGRRMLRAISARAVTDAVGDALGQVLLTLITLTWTKGIPMALGALLAPLVFLAGVDGAPRLAPRPSETVTLRPLEPNDRAEVTEPIECTDARGRSAAFRAVLFSRAYSWRLGETDVELSEPGEDFLEILQSPGLSDYVTAAPEVVVVGTASCEGYPERREQEIELAERRAGQLHRWIERVRRRHHDGERTSSVHALNLGVHRGPCTGGDTWRQRRILLFAVDRSDDRLDLLECLAGALEDRDDLRYLVTRYDPGFGPEAELF